MMVNIRTTRAWSPWLCVTCWVVLITCGEAEATVSDGLVSTGTFGRGLLGDTEQTSAPASCTRDFDCDSQSYCKPYAASNSQASPEGLGSCAKCWKCCLYPDMYGACPQWCGCGRSADQLTACYQVSDCGPGSACIQDAADQVPTCQSCDSCYLSSPLVVGGNCSEYCPYSEEYQRIWSNELTLNQVLETPSSNSTANASLPSWVYTTDLKTFSLRHLMYLAFTAAEMFAEGSMNETALAAWMSMQGVLVSSERSQYTFGLYDINSDMQIEAWEWIVVSLVYDPKVLICPDADLIQELNMTIVFPGCPCVPATGPAYGMCPAGYRCSRTANALQQTALDSVLMRDTRTGAMCTACVPGQYCPAGTYVEDEHDLSSLDCKRGQYCPDPSEQLPCPAGSFCTSSSVQPVTCDISAIIATDTFAVYSQEDYFVTRVYQGKEALKGNYCPVNSTKPSQLCPKGTHCPDPATSLKCPKGYHCPMQSVTPKKCGWLEDCSKEGVANPMFSKGAFVNTVLVILGSLWLYGLISWHQSHLEPAWQQAEDELDDEERQLPQLRRVLLKLRRLHQGLSRRLSDRKQADANITPLRRWLDNTKASREGRRNTREKQQLQSPYQIFSNLAEISIRFMFKEVRMGTGRKKMLEGVHGQFLPASLNAILGPSGCGKTTLLKALFGHTRVGTQQQQGRWSVWYNDMSLAAIARVDLPKIIGFVPQDDILHEDLTVRENLFYAASLKLDPRVEGRRKQMLIEEALAMLSLLKKKDAVVGSVEKKVISGGERKRVNVAIELVGMPSLLFLDEPTSGLDSTNSMTVLWGLEALTRLGMNIVTVIHQPRSIIFHLFDQVLLLGEAGSTVYQGPPMLASPYFSMLHFVNKQSENPADFFLDIISGRAEMEADCRFVIERHHLAPIWASGGAVWMKSMMAANVELTSQRPMLKAVTPEVVESLKRYFDRVVSRHNASDDDMITSSELAALFRTELGIACDDIDVHALIQVMNGDGIQGLSRKELQNALCRPPIEVVKLESFLSALVIAKLDDAWLEDFVHYHKGSDDGPPAEEGIVVRLTSQLRHSIPSAFSVTRAKSLLPPSHQVSALIARDDLVERKRSEHAAEAAAPSSSNVAPPSPSAVSSSGISLPYHAPPSMPVRLPSEAAAAELAEPSSHSVSARPTRFKPAVAADHHLDAASAPLTMDRSHVSFSTASAPTSPFSSHLQQPFGAHPTPFGAVRDDAVLPRANSDQSLAKMHSVRSLLTASSFAGPEHSELSIQQARSKSVRFVGAEHPAILMEKLGMLDAKAGPELGAIKHCPLPTARSLQQGLDADKLASHHPQLKAVLKSRNIPSMAYQFWKLCLRTATKQCRSWPYPIIDICLLVGAAHIIGFIHGTSWRPGRFPNNVVMAMTALGVLSTTIHIRTLDQHHALFAREVSSGMSITAYYLATTVVDIFWVLVSPAVFLAVYYHLTLPQTPFSMFYAAALGVCWWNSGMAYALSALLPRKQTLVGTVFVALVMGAFINGIDPSLRQTKGTFLEVVESLSYTRWSMELLAIEEFGHYLGNMKNTIMSTMSFLGICAMELPPIDTAKGLSVQQAISLARMQQSFEDRYSQCDRFQAVAFLMLFGQGLVMRICALLLLHWPVPKLLKACVMLLRWPFRSLCTPQPDLWWEEGRLGVEATGTSSCTAPAAAAVGAQPAASQAADAAAGARPAL